MASSLISRGTTSLSSILLKDIEKRVPALFHSISGEGSQLPV
ncbi:MAG: hypothetical protein R2744_03960 [Bacteroidales bacterium]